MDGLLNLMVALIIVGVALHLINRYVPVVYSARRLPPGRMRRIKMILNVVVVAVVFVWLLEATGF
jgi:uncharacterized membrane-anchored protein